MTTNQIESKTKSEGIVYPTNTAIIVNTKDLYNHYFNSVDGVGRTWKVVQDFPRLSVNKKTIFVKAWFHDLSEIVKIDILNFESLGADKFQLIAFLSLIQMNMAEVAYFDKNKTALLEKFATLAGHDPIKLTRAQTLRREALKKSNPSTFTTGFLYSDYQITEYAPEKAMVKN